MIQNVIKGWLTTLLGFAIIAFTIYAMDTTDALDWMKGLSAIGVGLVLLFVKDSDISDLLKKIVDKILNK